jgi:hypothetical protein
MDMLNGKTWYYKIREGICTLVVNINREIKVGKSKFLTAHPDLLRKNKISFKNA